MNKKIKDLWIKELRSGSYKQGIGYLRQGDKFCCLGVLCNLHAKLHPEIAANEVDSGAYLGEYETLPKIVQQWANVDMDGSYYNKTPFETSLATQNDSYRKTFEEIADIIEEHF